MIGRLRGTLVEKLPPEVLIDVNGVGYEVMVPMTTLYQLPEPGGELVLYTHLVVREDAHLLYGFADRGSRALFRDLIKVNGVGPKMALTIMSGIDSDEFVRCVRNNDAAALVRLPGVGKKTAERLLVEMRDRLKAWQTTGGGVVDAALAGNGSRDRLAEAEAALIALGYKPQEAARAISGVGDDSLSSEELIRIALKNMIRN